MTDDELIGGVLEREGWPKYTEHAADRGGPTKGGITLESWREFTKNPQATAADVRAIDELQARTFYRWRHIVAPRFAEITDPNVRELAIDAGVLHGTRHAAKWLQYGADVGQDGVLGPISLRAINDADPGELILWVSAYRIRLFGRLVSSDPELRRAKAAGMNLQAIFAAGWNNRAADFLESFARRLDAAHKARR